MLKNKAVRRILIGLGTLSVGLGILGIFLPLLPTTPFLLLAAACYARSSERFYNRLLNHQWLGKYIRDYREGLGIPMRTKIGTLILLWITILLSALFAVEILWVRILLFTIAAGVTIFLLSRPTKKFLEVEKEPL